MREARLLELDWIKKEKVYDNRSRVEAEKKGMKPIQKGQEQNIPFARSRICVRECQKGQNAVESLEPEQLFATVGGFEIAVFSEGVPEDFSQEQAFEASSFRHFRTSCRKHAVSSTKGFVGLRQEDYTGTLAQRGYTPGRSNPAMFHSHRGGGRMLVHGDDFVLLADDGEIKAVEQLLKSKYTVKVVSVIGDGSLQQEAVILNRIVRYVPPNKANRMAMEIEPDQRHVDILLREHAI